MRHGKAYTFLAMDKWQYEEEDNINRVWHEYIYKNDDMYQDICFHRDGGYQVEHLKNWEKHGIQESYYPNGNMHYKRKYVEGKLDGHEKWFYEDGSRHSDFFRVKGLKQGSFIGYQKDGNFLERRNYEDGYISGLFIKNHRGSKEIECRGSYIPIKNIVTKKTALEMLKDSNAVRQYLENHNIELDNIKGGSNSLMPLYRVSLKNGLWEYFDEQGELKAQILFKNGKPV